MNRLAREATQTGEVTKQLEKDVPSRTSRSRCGVFIQGAPRALIVSVRCWSVMMKTMLGWSPGAAPLTPSARHRRRWCGS